MRLIGNVQPPSNSDSDGPASSALVSRFARIGKFGVVSGVGLAMDFCISVALRESGVPPFGANLTGATCAVTFVFFASVRHVFDGHPGHRGRKYAAYMLWQAIAVPAASILIARLTPFGDSLAESASQHLEQWKLHSLSRLAGRPGTGFLLAKCAFTPVTFYANFLFMGWLLTGRVRWR